MQRKRSEVRYGVRILEVLFGGWALAVLAGCEYSPEIEDIVEKRFVYSEQNLTPAALAERTRKIDEDYAEPRTPTKVQLSYELSLDSISRVNSYEAGVVRRKTALAIVVVAPGHHHASGSDGQAMPLARPYHRNAVQDSSFHNHLVSPPHNGTRQPRTCHTGTNDNNGQAHDSQR